MKIALRQSLAIGLSSLALLIIPLIATYTAADFNWSLSDFLVFGALLFVFGSSIAWVYKQEKKRRFLIIVFLVILFLLIWAELGVGLFGSPLAGS